MFEVAKKMPFKCVPSKYGHSVSPLPSAEELSSYYQETYYQEPEGQYRANYDQGDLDYFAQQSQIALEFAANAGVNDGNLLDLGCGEGFFLEFARSQGFKVWGVDNSSFGISQHNPRLLVDGEFQQGDALASRWFDGLNFDLVYCKNVAEHAIDPDILLTRIGEYLAPNGVAIIEVPNDFSRLHETIFRGVDKERSPMFCPPVHLHYFNTSSLPNVVRAAGFDVVDCFSDYPIDHLLLADSFDYYKNKTLGSDAHKLRRQFAAYLASVPVASKLSLLRSLFSVGLGRNIAVVFKNGPRSEMTSGKSTV